MKFRQEQEERLKQTLDGLKVFITEGKLQIQFKSSRNRGMLGAAAVGLSESKDKAILVLSEPSSDQDYDDWSEALAKVFDVLDDVDTYRSYKLKSPVFWEAIQCDFKFSNLKSQNDE